MFFVTNNDVLTLSVFIWHKGRAGVA